MASLNELLAQQQAIEIQIAELRLQKHEEAVGRVKVLVAEFGLVSADIFGPAGNAKGVKLAKDASKKVEPKYRDPVSGATWTGRGMTPKWAQGVDKATLLIRD